MSASSDTPGRVPLPDDLTEGEAVELFEQLQARFRWAGAVFQRHDVEVAFGTPIDDAAWAELTWTGEWAWVSEAMIATGIEALESLPLPGDDRAD